MGTGGLVALGVNNPGVVPKKDVRMNDIIND